MTGDRIRKDIKFLFAGLIVFSIGTVAYLEAKDALKIKKSPSGLCHGPESPHYRQVFKYEPYNTLRSCLESGGRFPRGKALEDIENERENL